MKLSAPLLSLGATGEIGHGLIVQHRGNSWSGSLPFSRDDIGSDQQLLYRDNFDRALGFWRADQMSTDQKQAWLNLCSRYSLPMSGYNLFMRWSLFSLRDSDYPAAAIFSDEYYGGAYAWEVKDIRTGGACSDVDVYQVWAWQDRAARALLCEIAPNAQGRIILAAGLRPPSGNWVSISVLANHRSGVTKIYTPPQPTWQNLKDMEITWGKLKDDGTTWNDLKGV